MTAFHKSHFTSEGCRMGWGACAAAASGCGSAQQSAWGWSSGTATASGHPGSATCMTERPSSSQWMSPQRIAAHLDSKMYVLTLWAL